MAKQLKFFFRIALDQSLTAATMIGVILALHFLGFGEGRPVSVKFMIVVLLIGSMLGVIFRFLYYRDSIPDG